MYKIESDNHLYQRPFYQADNGSWHNSFKDALSSSKNILTCDEISILSIISFNYVCGDRTLIKDIRRKPWLSGITNDNKIEQLDILRHDRKSMRVNEISSKLINLLYEEVIRVCEGYDKIYLLLSGGLDSRVMAAIVTKAKREGKIKSDITAVTWGLSDSRDVYIAEKVANILKIEWEYIGLPPRSIINNIHLAALELACMVPGIHLHNLKWFQGVKSNALVLAASYGDSIGRAEFSKSHLLELKRLEPIDKYRLMKKKSFEIAYDGLINELINFEERNQNEYDYVIREHEMYCHYMRGQIAHAMSLINNYCNSYQLFTDPEVYGFVWSIHPSLRKNDIYAKILKDTNKKLLNLPWARTNKSLKGKTEGMKNNLRKNFHEYESWISGELYHEIFNLIDYDFLDNLNIFEMDSIKQLCENVRKRINDFRVYDIFTWLAGFSYFNEWLTKSGKKLRTSEFQDIQESKKCNSNKKYEYLNKVRVFYWNSDLCTKIIWPVKRKIERHILFKKYLKKYPPV